MRKIAYTLISLIVLSIYLSCVSKGKDGEVSDENNELDVLELIYSVADELDMKVMCDIDLRGGDLYRKKSVEELTQKSDSYIEAYHKRYGSHVSFWGWYLNNEINPIAKSDVEQSAFWRAVWKSVADKCHQSAPGTKVTISPFFLLDKQSLRGFTYQEPREYEEWWYHTMSATGIDILMLQDSGAEHLSFYTLEDRRPFFQAFSNACRRAGKEFWVNVETGQVEARDWPHALQMEKDFERAWTFTEVNWLKQKLDLAAEYGTGIVNWGYYPLMNPMEEHSVLTIQDIDGQEVNLAQRKVNYDAYKTYIKTAPKTIDKDKLALPKLEGTLWFLPSNIDIENKEELEKVVRQEIANQKNLGFTYLWICNTPEHFKSTLGDN